jgi:predicted DNA-binding transcriptional regulator AlpA
MAGSDGGRLLDVDDLAEVWNVTRSWIYANADKLPTIRLGKQLRWRRGDLDAWLDGERERG